MTLKYNTLIELVNAVKEAGYKTQISTAELNKLIMSRVGPSLYTRIAVKEALKTGELLYQIDVNLWELPEEYARRQAADEKTIADMMAAKPI